MKFTRRPDSDPQTRIKIVNLAWLYQGVYGKMTKIAQQYQISQTFLYRLLLMATVQLETLFRNEKRLVQNDPPALRPLALLAPLGRPLLAAEYGGDLASAGLPFSFRRFSQSVLPQGGPGTSFHPREAVTDLGVLSQ